MADILIPRWLTAVVLLPGPVLIALGLPLARRRIPPNWFYGVRTSATLANTEVWYAINAQGGRALATIGGGYMLAMLGAQVAGAAWPAVLRLLGPLGLLLAGLIIETIVLVRAGNRMLAARRTADHRPAPP